MTLELAKMCHNRIPCLVIVIVLDLIVYMILTDHRQGFGIVVVSDCIGEGPLVISFRLHSILYIPLMIGIFPMAPRHHHHLLLTTIQIITGAVLLVGVVLGHTEVVPHQAGWRGVEGDIMMAPRMGEEELYQDPLHLLGTSLWIWSKMVSKVTRLCIFLALSLLKQFQDHIPLTLIISSRLMAPHLLQICFPHLYLRMGLPLLLLLRKLTRPTYLTC